ncbi:MAG: hypothetical protein GXO70_03820 [Acidobacteria bacterium]|nr:hypothetical protein [Acidobacteriota bacterium]
MVKQVQGILKDDGGRRIITAAFCCNGHNLISDDNPKIDGLSTIHLRVHSASAGDVDIYLSPIQGDGRVKGGEDIPRDELLGITCPVCGTSFEVVAPCYCRHGMFVAIYLKQDCRYRDAVVVCDSWGCKHSFIKLESRIILSSS